VKEREKDRVAPGEIHAGSAARVRPQPKDRTGSSQNPVLNLQQTIGNQGVMRLLQSGAIQTRLRVSQPGDADEMEADRVADQVVSSAPSTLHRKCSCEGGASCPACEEEKVEQAKGVDRKESSSLAHADQVSASLPPGLSSGHNLDAGIRGFMESHFGVDFSAVRIHTDETAAESADSINADAYTHVNHIYFADGKYDPVTSAGRHLLAHELTHTLQQQGEMRSATHKLLNPRLAAVFPGVQRQVAGAPDPNKFNRCRDLLGQIKATVAVLLQRAADLINDPLGLQWDNWNVPKILPDGTNLGSVVGHQQQYEGWRNRLRNLIEEWDNDDCNSTGLRVLKDARDLQFKPAPSPTPRPRPETGPKPWTPPGSAPSESPTAKRLAAAAKGAAIGATAGLVLGGIAGAIGGGAGGTLVAPGVGTVGGGVAGAIAGAEAGAPIGAALGASIGSLIGWLTSP
jgi:hypothetical protein